MASTADHKTLLQKALRDLKRHASELERSNRDLEQFAYAASHDLQTPLRKVKSFSLLLRDELEPVLADLDEEQRVRVAKYFSYIIEGAERSQDLINGLLSFSRTGRKVEKSPVCMRTCIDGALFILDEDIREKGAEVTCPADWPTVCVDESLMTRVFQNLVGNAIKFRDDDRAPRIRISYDERERELLVSVQDNGIGIDARHQERVFLIFQRIGTKKRGTGLGLALCKKIIESHGGRIWFESVVGVGTTFNFTLPREQQCHGQPVDEA